MAESELATLLRTMEPVQFPRPYAPVVRDGAAPFPVLATVAEGQTVVAELADLEAAGYRSAPWARISLTAQSDLAAVDLTAALAGAPGRAGTSCNVIAGFHHDHLFVPWGRRFDALTALEALCRA